MKETMSLVLATAILALGGLGLYMYKQSDDFKDDDLEDDFSSDSESDFEYESDFKFSSCFEFFLFKLVCLLFLLDLMIFLGPIFYLLLIF